MTTLEYDPELASKGNWSGTKLGDRRSAIVTCPACGQEISLSHFYIFYDGKVTPSLVCPHDGCDFHDWITLENWSQ